MQVADSPASDAGCIPENSRSCGARRAGVEWFLLLELGGRDARAHVFWTCPCARPVRRWRWRAGCSRSRSDGAVWFLGLVPRSSMEGEAERRCWSVLSKPDETRDVHGVAARRSCWTSRLDVTRKNFTLHCFCVWQVDHRICRCFSEKNTHPWSGSPDEGDVPRVGSVHVCYEFEVLSVLQEAV